MRKDELKNKLIRISCPLCGMSLINLTHGEFYESKKKSNEYWCANCGIDITIKENE